MTDTYEDIEGISESLGYEPTFFQQADVVQFVMNPLGDIWSIVYQNEGYSSFAPAIFSCLANRNQEDRLLQDTTWIKHPLSFGPGFYTTADGTYYDTGADDGYDFLVKEIYFHALELKQLHINQEFVFLFDLFRDDDACYYAIDDCGRKEKVVDISENVVKIKTSYLMRYIAAKQVLYVQFVDSRRFSSPDYPIDAEQVYADEQQGDTYHYEISYQSTARRDYLFSMVFARSIVHPQAVDKCGISPYDENAEERYPEFTIEELPDGTRRRFTCDPRRLSNFFGANPGAPHYLTPIFFNPGVLERYRNDPHFDVTERRLSCGTQWGIEIDNVIPGRVMVYLGDLGRDLPESERIYFQGFEISPAGQCVSRTAVEQDFHCSFNAPMGPLTAFFFARDKLNAAWTARFGKPLYRQLHSDEQDMEKLIRIPSGNGRQESDTVILNLTKYCIDYIDEDALNTTGASGGINRLEATLTESGIYCDLTPLRDLQAIRSRGIAHAKGTKYEKLKGSLLTGDNTRDISKLINRLTSMMEELTTSLSSSTEAVEDEQL